MATRKEADIALYKLWKETRVSDYKTKIKPQMEIIESFLDRTCVWKYLDDDYYYEAECGSTMQFTDERDSVTDFDFNFCPNCGGKVVEFEIVEKQLQEGFEPST